MPREELPVSLQESVLAAILYDDKTGAAIAAQVTPGLFDETYREIAERALSYRRKYQKAPGVAHLDDLFGKLLSVGRAPRLRRLVFDLAELSGGINGPYVLNSIQDFIRGQKIKEALIQSNARYEQGGDDWFKDVEANWSRAMRFRTNTMDAGTFLNDTKKTLKFFDRDESGVSLGVKELDQLGVKLRAKRMMLYLSPKGTGKSWTCVHVGVQSLMQGEKPLHLALEMDEEETAGRYYQRIFAGALREDKFNRSFLEFDELGRLSGYKTRSVAPRLDFSQPGARRLLLKKLKPWGTRLGRLVIKEFASGSLTMDQLEAYLDYLELECGYIPTVLIVDYPDLMLQDPKNLRVSLGQTYVNLRGLAQKRGLKLFCPTQGGRATIRGKNTRSKDVTEDISKIFTADDTITYQRTEAEEEKGLARLRVEHARGTFSGATIVITQSYATGQWCLQSALMQQAYWRKMQAEEGGQNEQED